jgi:hypothetical protein
MCLIMEFVFPQCRILRGLEPRDHVEQERLRPLREPSRKGKHHQHLTEKIGNPKLLHLVGRLAFLAL